MRALTSVIVLLLAIGTGWTIFGCGGPSEFIGAAADGEKLVEKSGCRECHVINGEGADKAPDLDDAIARIGEVQVRKQIKDPTALNPNSVMPKYDLTEKERDAVLAYLREIQE